MMKRFNFNHATKALLGAGLLSFVLTGCGSDGEDGKPGPDGQPGEVALTINDVTKVVTKVETASYDEASKTLSVEFSLTNANGVAITGLETLKDPIRLAFGRMGTRGEAFKSYKVGEKEVTATADANNEIWLSYNNKLNTTTGLHAGTANWRPNANCAEGSQCLTYLGQGKYKITAANIINTNGLDYGYDATKTQGIYLITYEAGANKVKNTEMYYWNPADGKKVSSPRAEMPDQTCTNCHVGSEHIRHSNYGNTAEQCSFCHTDYTQYQTKAKDAEGNDVVVTYNGSTKGLVHGFHVGATESHRRTVGKFAATINSGATKNPAFTYKFDRAVANADGKPLNFPAAAANCQQCHVDATTTVETLPAGLSPLALAWFADTDVNSCQSCHGDYHYGNQTKDIPADPSNPESPLVTTAVGCVDCHSSYEGKNRGGAFRHFAGANADSRQAASQAGLLLKTSYSDVAWNETSSTLTFKMNIAKTTATGSEPVTKANIVGNPTVYVNAVDNVKPDAYIASRTTGSAVANDDGSFTVTVNATSASAPLPSLATAINSGKADLALFASYNVCFNNKADTLRALAADGTCGGVASPNAAVSTFIKLDGTQGVSRKSAANYQNCLACHNNDMVVRSGGYHYRNADLHSCAQCHEGSDNNSMVVRVHGTFDKAHGRTDVNNLVVSSQCSTCHNNSDYALDNARSTPMRWNRRDATFSSPQAGVCASCHVSDAYTIGGGKDAAKAHIEGMGGIVAGTYTEAQTAITGNTESCQTCHSAEYIKTKHKF